MHISNDLVNLCNIQIVIQMLKIQITVLQVRIRGYLIVKLDLLYKYPFSFYIKISTLPLLRPPPLSPPFIWFYLKL